MPPPPLFRGYARVDRFRKSLSTPTEMRVSNRRWWRCQIRFSILVVTRRRSPSYTGYVWCGDMVRGGKETISRSRSRPPHRRVQTVKVYRTVRKTIKNPFARHSHGRPYPILRKISLFHQLHYCIIKSRDVGVHLNIMTRLRDIPVAPSVSKLNIRNQRFTRRISFVVVTCML